MKRILGHLLNAKQENWGTHRRNHFCGFFEKDNEGKWYFVFISFEKFNIDFAYIEELSFGKETILIYPEGNEDKIITEAIGFCKLEDIECLKVKFLEKEHRLILMRERRYFINED